MKYIYAAVGLALGITFTLGLFLFEREANAFNQHQAQTHSWEFERGNHNGYNYAYICSTSPVYISGTQTQINTTINNCSGVTNQGTHASSIIYNAGNHASLPIDPKRHIQFKMAKNIVSGSNPVMILMGTKNNNVSNIRSLTGDTNQVEATNNSSLFDNKILVSQGTKSFYVNYVGQGGGSSMTTGEYAGNDTASSATEVGVAAFHIFKAFPNTANMASLLSTNLDEYREINLMRALSAQGEIN